MENGSWILTLSKGKGPNISWTSLETFHTIKPDKKASNKNEYH